MRLLHMATLTVLTAAVVLPTGPAAARTGAAHAGFRHVRHARGAYPIALRGRSPAYAPPAPLGVGLFGTGLFYGYGFPELPPLF